MDEDNSLKPLRAVSFTCGDSEEKFVPHWTMEAGQTLADELAQIYENNSTYFSAPR